jgi:hypothetical protein
MCTGNPDHGQMCLDNLGVLSKETLAMRYGLDLSQESGYADVKNKTANCRRQESEPTRRSLLNRL